MTDQEWEWNEKTKEQEKGLPEATTGSLNGNRTLEIVTNYNKETHPLYHTTVTALTILSP